MADFTDLPNALQLDTLPDLLESDEQLKAFLSNAIEKPVTFGIKSSGSDNTLLITISNGSAKHAIGKKEDAEFTLSALPEQWTQFFQPVPKPPYQSYWGILGTKKEKGAEVLGDQTAFAQWASVWRRVLELLHTSHCGPIQVDEEKENLQDYISGKYIYLTTPGSGTTKIFYEYSGEGRQSIIFLHSPGSDGRQYHGVLNDPRMRKKCTMYTFDLPGHGRSFPAGANTSTEDAYVGIIAAFVKKLGLRRPILVGEGGVCLSVAGRNREVGVGGVVPVLGGENLDTESLGFDKSPSLYVNQALFNAERVYGMMSPTAPQANKNLLWHIYSSQAYGIPQSLPPSTPSAELPKINTSLCPVFLLTGSYDFTTSPETAQATVDKIPGAEHRVMEGVGHFAATEKPGVFVGYLLEAVNSVMKIMSENLSSLRLGGDG